MVAHILTVLLHPRTASQGFCFGARIISTTKLVKMARPRPLVFCGPSGSGKSTLIKKMMEEFTDCFGFSISHTTRKPRPGEVNGKDYHFVSRDEMEAAVKNGEFIESAQFSANLYGTSKKAVEDVLKTGKICVLDIDVQGVKSMKNTDLNPKYIFVKPPDMKALEQRLRNRGTETEESLEKRLTTARSEMEYANTPGNFDVVIVNDVVDVAYSELKESIKDDVAAVKKRND